jgi:hypothetical protein
MTKVPWSDKGEKSAMDITDELMMYIPSEVLVDDQNQRITRPNLLSSLSPPRQVNVLDQGDLEAAFGTEIIIPDGKNMTVVFDDSLELTKPILIGENASLEVYASTRRTDVHYSTPGSLFQNEDPAKPMSSLTVRDCILRGNGTNSIFDVKTDALSPTASALLDIRAVQMVTWGSLGTVEFPFCKIVDMLPFNIVTKGLVIKNPRIVDMEASFISQFPPTSSTMTYLSFILGQAASISINKVVNSASFPVEKFLFLDPNAPAGSSFVVKQSNSLAGGEFYQSGSDVNVVDVLSNGGQAEFAATIPANIDVGTPVVLKGFTEPTYNGTHIITTTNFISTFEVGIPFTASDTGILNASSLDGTDIRVTAEGNPGNPDSMFTAEASLELGAPFTVTINFQDVPEVITNAGWVYNKLERFEEDTGTPNEGRVITKGKSTRKYSVTYSGTIKKSGGGTNIGVVLLRDGTNISVNPPRIFEGNSALPISRTEIVELGEGEIPQVAVVNYSGSANIEVFQINMAINRA